MNRALPPVAKYTMRGARDETAALNNAEWCAAVWRSHGLVVEQAHGLWFCRGPAPQFYPNVVTVDRAADPGAQAAFIAELAGATRTGVSVKDSFERLDLAPMGFQILFEARWLWSERPAPPTNYGDLRWDRIGEEGRLAQWERAWRGADRNAERTFRADLLGDERVSILAGVDATGEIIGGGIGFRAAGVEGVTNLFGPRRAFIDALRAAGAAAPIVCYEQGDDLAAAIQTGFEPLGGLRIWSCRPR